MFRTQKIKIKKGHRMYNYFDEICFNAKNLYNIGNFYVRQCLTGLKKDAKNITSNEKEAIKYINNAIPQLNQIKLNYYHKRLDKESQKPKKERKEVNKPTQYKKLSKDNSFLSYNILEGIFKLNKQPDYVSLPGQVNQQVLKLLMRDWKSFFKTNKDYKNNPEKYKGKPKPPKYAKFLDYDIIPTYKKDSKKKHKFSGTRVKRGLYKTKSGNFINADVNAALNIILKVIPDAFGIRDIGLVDSP